MKRNKITNVSGINLKFFVKVENSEDKLIDLEPGSVCFSDGSEMTKSMRILQRKNLLELESGEFPVIQGFSETVIENLSSVNPSIIPDATPKKKDALEILKTEREKLMNDFKNIDFEMSPDWAMKNILRIDPDNFGPRNVIDVDPPNLGPTPNPVIEDILKTAETQAKLYQEDGKKKYKYPHKKKVGRKKKRGPKPGAKKKKLKEEKKNSENNTPQS